MTELLASVDNDFATALHILLKAVVFAVEDAERRHLRKHLVDDLSVVQVIARDVKCTDRRALEQALGSVHAAETALSSQIVE